MSDWEAMQTTFAHFNLPPSEQAMAIRSASYMGGCQERAARIYRSIAASLREPDWTPIDPATCRYLPGLRK